MIFFTNFAVSLWMIFIIAICFVVFIFFTSDTFLVSQIIYNFIFSHKTWKVYRRIKYSSYNPKTLTYSRVPVFPSTYFNYFSWRNPEISVSCEIPDGPYFLVSGNFIQLLDPEGNILLSSTVDTEKFLINDILNYGNYEKELILEYINMEKYENRMDVCWEVYDNALMDGDKEVTLKQFTESMQKSMYGKNKSEMPEV